MGIYRELRAAGITTRAAVRLTGMSRATVTRKPRPPLWVVPARLGASHVVGVDIGGEFVTPEDDALDVMLLTADLSHLDQVTALSEQRFDVVLFLQSIGYAEDQVATLRAARQLIKDDGILVIARSSPCASPSNAPSVMVGLGTAYHSSAAHTYPSGWNDKILVSHRTNTFSDMINTVSEAGFRSDLAVEPQLSDQQKAAYPHKQAWLDKYIGIILFRARPLSPANQSRIHHRYPATRRNPVDNDG